VPLCVLLIAGCDLLGASDEPAGAVGASAKEVEALLDPSTMAEPWERGALRRGPVVTQVAVYGQGDDPSTLESVARRIVKSHSSALKIELEFPAMDTYAPPEPQMLEFVGVGLSSEQVRAVQEAKAVAVLTVSSDDASLAETAMAEAYALASDIAGKSNGLLWDESTRQLFSPEAWTERMAAGPSTKGERWRHFTVHNYRDGELIRQVSLGLGKFGVPELVNEGVTGYDGGAMGQLLNLVAEAMIDGAEVGDGGSLPVTTSDGRTVEIRLGVGTRQEGDAPGRLAVILFPGQGSLQQRQAALLDDVLGKRDGEILDAAADDAELLAASAKAKKELAGLKTHFAAGIPELEALSVKAPFDTDDGSVEWMWVEVTAWKGDTMKGILQNDPRAIADLRRGATVEVKVDALFDYLHRRADGSTAGGTTNDILQRRFAR